MKTVFLLLTLVLSTSLMSAQKYISKNGHVWFFSHTPMEDIEGHDRQVASILDISNGDLIFSLLVKSFEFKSALMQEHFNENYMESDKFPKALFKGKIKNSEKIDFKKDGVYPVEITGDMTIHGTVKPISVTGTIEIKGGVISAKSKFQLVPKDYDIKIPALVEGKIAKQLETSVELTYGISK